MTIVGPQPSKAELLLHLALGYHESNPDMPDAQERIRKGFNAIVAALRQLDFVPAADIDDFVKSVKAGGDFNELMAPAVLFATVLPDETFYSTLQESGMFDGMAEQAPVRPAYHPKFEQAMDRLKELMDTHGKDAMNHPESDALWAQAFEHAPAAFMQAVHDTAVELDLMPETKYVNDAGEPLFSAEQIAEKLGLPVEQVEKDIHEKFGDQLPSGNVHLLQ